MYKEHFGTLIESENDCRNKLPEWVEKPLDPGTHIDTNTNTHTHTHTRGPLLHGYKKVDYVCECLKGLRVTSWQHGVRVSRMQTWQCVVIAKLFRTDVCFDLDQNHCNTYTVIICMPSECLSQQESSLYACWLAMPWVTHGTCLDGLTMLF